MYMQVRGYKILGFILSLKSRELISIALMDELFEFCLSRGKLTHSTPSSSSSSYFTSFSSSMLLADTPSLYYLLLNHQIWSIKRYSFALKVICFLEALSSNSTYRDLNNRRLSALGGSYSFLALIVVTFSS
jgi:hypothetical protein